MQLETFQIVDNEAIEIADVNSIHPLSENTLPSPPDTLWLYGKTLKNIEVPGWNGLIKEATKNKHFEKSKILFFLYS